MMSNSAEPPLSPLLSTKNFGKGQSRPGRERGARPTEIRARAELWALRTDIEREKLRSVAPYPFFGRAMRFQDEYSSLQIMDDGRFSYSFVSFDAGDVAEQATSAGNESIRRAITYEGVFAMPSTTDVDGNMAEDAEMAVIEGHALARHESEEHSGRTCLTNVERGMFRFMITVSPFFQPAYATVQPVRPPSPGRLPPRKRQLPYVGTGICLRTNRGDSRHQRRANSGLKIQPSCPRDFPQSEDNSSMQLDSKERSLRGSQKLVLSASAPQLPTLASATKETATLTVSDWKEFYRQQASLLHKEM